MERERIVELSFIYLLFTSNWFVAATNLAEMSTSPGGWLLPKKPDEYSLDSIPSIRRNKTICRCFEMVGLIERNGSGLKKIYNVYKKTEVQGTSAE